MKLIDYTIVGEDAWGNPVTERVVIPHYNRLERAWRWISWHVLRRGRPRRISGIEAV